MAQKWLFFPPVMQMYTKFANFTGLYFPHFTTIRNQTLQFYSLQFYLESSIGAYWNHHIGAYWNHPLEQTVNILATHDYVNVFN
jgi:hypothetical protein